MAAEQLTFPQVGAHEGEHAVLALPHKAADAFGHRPDVDDQPWQVCSLLLGGQWPGLKLAQYLSKALTDRTAAKQTVSRSNVRNRDTVELLITSAERAYTQGSSNSTLHWCSKGCNACFSSEALQTPVAQAQRKCRTWRRQLQ